MTDKIIATFLADQTAKLQLLAKQSDIFNLESVRGSLFFLRFNCNGLVVDRKGNVHNHDDFLAALMVSPDFLRRPIEDPRHFITMLDNNIFHPNISGHAICVGKINAGTPLTYLVYQIYEILSYQKYTPREDDALNLAACNWARNNAEKFPIDARPLKRRNGD